MGDELRWLIGIGVSVIVAVGGMILGAMSRMTTKIDAGDNQLHERINRVRDDYVRRDDKEKSDARIEAMVKEIRDEQRAYHRDVLELLTRTQRGGNRRPQ